MSKLLIEDNPLMLLPKLAKAIGLHEAICMQQLHYWTMHEGPDGRKYGKVKDGKRWIRNTIENWQETNFPFFSESQIYRAFKNLEEQELVLSRKDLNSHGYDRTKWYAVNYAILRKREMEMTQKENTEDVSEETIPETTPETTPDRGGAKNAPKPSSEKVEYVDDPFEERSEKHVPKWATFQSHFEDRVAGAISSRKTHWKKSDRKDDKLTRLRVIEKSMTPAVTGKERYPEGWVYEVLEWFEEKNKDGYRGLAALLGVLEENHDWRERWISENVETVSKWRVAK